METVETNNLVLQAKLEGQKRRKRNKRKALILVLILGLTAVVLVVSTYAWFVGINTVQIKQFEVVVQTSEGLQASLDAEHFNSAIDVTQTTVRRQTDVTSDAQGTWSYPGAHNYWPSAQSSIVDTNQFNQTNILTPVSTRGEMDVASSTLKMFERTSLSSTGGGYTMTTALQNGAWQESDGVYTKTGRAYEGDGYLVFDLFLLNPSGNYNTQYDVTTDEAVYLDKENTSVKLIKDGTNEVITNVGFENSIRVAFMQIGRVEAYTPTVESAARSDVNKYTKIEEAANMLCGGRTVLAERLNQAADIYSFDYDDYTNNFGVNASVTNLCNPGQYDRTQIQGQGETWNIWEPNHINHTIGSVTHYQNYCNKRNVSGVTTTTACDPIEDKMYIYTYAVQNEINYTFNSNQTSAARAAFLTDRYDGLNGYISSVNPLWRMAYYTNDPILDQWYGWKTTGAPGNYTTTWAKNDAATIKANPYPQLFYLQPNSITKIRIYVYMEGQDVDNYDVFTEDVKITVQFTLTKTTPDLPIDESAEQAEDKTYGHLVDQFFTDFGTAASWDNTRN